MYVISFMHKSRFRCTCLHRFMVFILEEKYFSANSEALSEDVKNTLRFILGEQFVCQSRSWVMQALTFTAPRQNIWTSAGCSI